MTIKELNDLFKIFLTDLTYVQTFIKENFGLDKILLNKNGGRIPERDFAIKNSRIKGYAFHGYGCLFQFKDFVIDIDLRFEKVGFTPDSVSLYLQRKGKEIPADTIKEFLNSHDENIVWQHKEDGIYILN